MPQGTAPQKLYVYLYDDDVARLEPFGNHSGQQDGKVGGRHALQVDTGRRTAHPPLRRRNEDEDVADDTDNEDARSDVAPQQRCHHLTERRRRRFRGHMIQWRHRWHHFSRKVAHTYSV